MPRLKKELVEARESFATQCAKEGKGLEDIQKLLVETGPGGVTGMRMFVPRLETLIKEAQTGLPSTIKTPPVPTSTPETKAAPGLIPVLAQKVERRVKIEAPPEEMKTAKCGADCGNDVIYPASRFTGKSLPFCSSCKKSGIIAVTRRN
jgi:hypothetical protein